MLVYSAGLRVGEVVPLRVENIDGERHLIHVQELLGHASSKTTEIYTHVSQRDLGRIRSPLDTLSLTHGESEGE